MSKAFDYTNPNPLHLFHQTPEHHDPQAMDFEDYYHGTYLNIELAVIEAEVKQDSYTPPNIVVQRSAETNRLEIVMLRAEFVGSDDELQERWVTPGVLEDVRQTERKESYERQRDNLLDTHRFRAAELEDKYGVIVRPEDIPTWDQAMSGAESETNGDVYPGFLTSAASTRSKHGVFTCIKAARRTDGVIYMEGDHYELYWQDFHQISHTWKEPSRSQKDLGAISGRTFLENFGKYLIPDDLQSGYLAGFIVWLKSKEQLHTWASENSLSTRFELWDLYWGDTFQKRHFAPEG